MPSVLAWLSVWSNVQMICIWSSWRHCHPIISCSSKIQNGLPFWCRPTQVVQEKRPLNGCSSRTGRLYSSCVRSSMLHGSETWPVKNENEMALQWAEMRMVRWMCAVKVKDPKYRDKELRQRLGIDDIILVVQQNRLWWYGHVLQKEDTDWVS